MAAPSDIAMSPAKFDPFHIHTTSYKTVNGHPIGVDVLIPKELKSGKRPLLVRFHGGYLVTGASLFPFFFTNWILELATSQSAIVVSADYRLLPEANGNDILADIADFWKWVREDLQPYLKAISPESAPEVDFDHILTNGESAGGYLAVQSALTQSVGSIKAVIGIYPQLDVGDDYYNKSFTKLLFGIPMLPNELVDTHVASTAPGAIVTSATPPSRVDLACAIVQNGRLVEFLGSDKALFPVEVVGKVDSMPPLLILHGKEDSAVPVVGSERFVEAFKKKHPSTPVKLSLHTGAHGFDDGATLETEWLKEDVDFITKYWLA